MDENGLTTAMAAMKRVAMLVMMMALIAATAGRAVAKPVYNIVPLAKSYSHAHVRAADSLGHSVNSMLISWRSTTAKIP